MRQEETPNTSKTPEPVFISRAECARLLGVHIRTVERMIRDGEVPSRRLRRRVMIPAQFLQTLVNGNEKN